MYAMPLCRFWAYNKNVDRIIAEQQAMNLNIMASSQSQDGYKAAARSLSDIKGEVVVVEKKLDTPADVRNKLMRLLGG